MDIVNTTGFNNCTTKVMNQTNNGASLSQGFSIAMTILFTAIIVTSIIANALLILTIALSRHLYSITHVFIVNLAIGDVITALFVIPFDVSFMIHGYHTFGIVPCGFMHIGFLMSLPLAVLNLCLLTVERFLTISYPFKRHTYFTAPKITVMLISTWLYTLLISLAPVMHNSNILRVADGFCGLNVSIGFTIFHGVLNFLIPIIGILVLNFFIVRIANRHERRIHATIKDRKKHQKKLLSFRKGAKRIMLLVGVCVFTWVTFIILVIWNTLCNVCHPRELTWIGNAINYSSVSVNPILYGIINTSIRREMWKRFRKLLSIKYHAENSTESFMLK